MNPLAYLDRIANKFHLRLIDVFCIVALTRQAPLVLVDNTFLSSFYASPLLQGAEIVTHSLTKYINGRFDVVMGAAILPYIVYARQRLRQPRPKASLPLKFTWRQNSPSAYEDPQYALCISSFLASHPAVEHVIYPGLAASHSQHGLARTSLSPHT